MIKVGPLLGWIDRPDDPSLKSHRVAAVPLGGIGIWTGVVAVSVFSGVAPSAMIVSSAMLVVLGLLDDRLSIPPVARLAVEAVAGLVLGWGRGHGLVEALSVALIVLVAVNAVNLFDGLDGLAGGSGLLAMLGIAALGVGRGHSPVFALIVSGALLGFLVWNWNPARLFLGNNGAYGLALFIVAGIDQVSPTVGELTVAAALLGVYLIDIAATVIRRIVVSQPMFSRDRLHLYDRLAERGVPIRRIALASAALQALMGIIVLVVDRSLTAPLATFVLLLVGTLLVVGLVRLLGATRPGFWTTQ
jgi:UDP-GlcNAc:undecaprenyl-phosphate GlcNAc-1-phosphate transferase